MNRKEFLDNCAGGLCSCAAIGLVPDANKDLKNNERRENYFPDLMQKQENHRWTRKKPARLVPQPRVLDCGGKRSATPLSQATCLTKGGVAAALCHRTPNY